MVKVERTITIHAPAKKVFDYIAGTTTLLEVWPGMIEAKNVKTLPNGGHRFHWAYKMAGVRFEGDSEDVEFVANKRIVSKTKGGIDSTITWEFKPQNGDTTVVFDAEYNVPIPLVGKLAETFIAKENEHEAEALLANLKSRMET